MKGIFHRLPSLASDYSGACGVLLEMGGLTVLCDASGCAGSFLVLDDPRWHSGPQRFYCAALRERDIVLGFDQKLAGKIEKTYQVMGGDFVALVGTPVPTIVATDYRGLCRALERRTGAPAIGIGTTGLEWYDAGQRKTYEMLLERFQNSSAPAAADVHVIGATPLDMWDQNQTRDLLDLLRTCGAERPAAWGMLGGGLPEIAGISRSRLNVAVSVSALPIVRGLRERFGTPYLIGYPIGEKAERAWSARAAALLRGEGAQPLFSPGPARPGPRALILGEQVAAESLRTLLLGELGFGQVDVATYFTLDCQLARPEDRKLVEEDDLAQLIREREPYDVILGDPLLRGLLPDPAVRYVELPHTAISSRAFWNRSPNCLGEKGSRWFREKLGDLAAE